MSLLSISGKNFECYFRKKTYNLRNILNFVKSSDIILHGPLLQNKQKSTRVMGLPQIFKDMIKTSYEKREKLSHALLIFSTFFLYITLTGAKNLYVAEKTTLTGFFSELENPLTAIASTMEYYFYAYAAMQILIVFIMKKINLKWFLSLTIGASAVTTVLIGLTNTITEHYVIHIINGILQAGVWGCSIKTLGVFLPQRLLPLANTLMTAGPAVAGIISYGTAAAFGDNWRLPFIVLGIVVMAAVILFFVAVTAVAKFPRKIETHTVTHSDGTTEEVDNEEENDFIHLDSKKRVIVFYIVSVFMGLLVTALFFMLNNNLDIFLKEIGGFSNSTAKLLTILAPISIVIGPVLSVKFCEKHRNFITVAFVFFFAAFIFAIALLLFFNANIMLSLVLTVFFLILTNGGRSVSLSIAALRMRSKIDTGVYSTLVNAAASLSSGIAPKLLSIILDNSEYSTVKSWSVSFSVIAALSAAVVISLLLINLWIYLINRKKASV